MEKVALIGCENYDLEEIINKLKISIEALGGFDRFLKPGQTVLLKVNLLMKRKPQEATTTHPTFVKALGILLMDFGVEVIIGDSPGGPFNEKALKGIYEVCGFSDFISSGMVLNQNFNSCSHICEEALLMKKIDMIEVAQKVDAIISVSKLKTHGMTKFTGAVKNMYGLIPGLKKAEYHYTLPNITDFSQMLVDVCMHGSPVLSFMDGIVAMEGAGPSGGEPRQVGVILASSSPYHLDVAACKIVGINPLEVPTIARSIERKLLSRDLNDFEMVLEAYESFYIADFKIPNIHGVGLLENRIPKWLDAWVNYIIKPKPVIQKDACIGCGECALCCPAKTIEMKNSRPVIHLNECIRCFCCQELCPAKAIEVHRTYIGKKLIKF